MADVASIRAQADELSKGSDGQWDVLVRQGRFSDRFCEGLVREMAEALWANVIRGYPGLASHALRPSLALFASGGASPERSWAVGRAGECIVQARTCYMVLMSGSRLGSGFWLNPDVQAELAQFAREFGGRE